MASLEATQAGVAPSDPGLGRAPRSGVQAVHARATAFARSLGLALPLLQAPMAGVPSLALAQAVSAAGGLAALGALPLVPSALVEWVVRFRAAAGAAAPLHINLWVPDSPPRRDPAHEARVAAFLARHGPPVPAGAGHAKPPDFGAQFEAVLALRPAVLSTVMGLLTPEQASRLGKAGIAWWATVSTVAEARAAARAGAQALVVQGAEAGGHRAAFAAERARDEAVGLMALLPAVVDAVEGAVEDSAGDTAPLPVLAAGGIGDARTAAAALLLGASGLQIGTALLRCPEAGIAPVWQAALADAAPESTRLTRAFSGRWGRALVTPYVQAADAADAPEPAPYPVQRGLTAALRQAGEASHQLAQMQAWAGQGAALARPKPAERWLRELWADTSALLGAAG